MLQGKVVSYLTHTRSGDVEIRIIASDDGVEVYQEKCNEALNQVRKDLQDRNRKRASIKLDPKEVIEVRLSYSTMRETYLGVDKRSKGYHNDTDYYKSEDFPDKTLEDVYFELEEAYENSMIKFRISDID